MGWMLEPLNDSHTFFLPPRRPYDVQNGWELGFVGEKCYITAVQPGSDAAAQGIKPGDEVISLEDYAVTRENLWKLQYAFGVLAPRAGMHLVLHSRDGKTRTLLVNAKVEKLARAWDPEGPEEYSRWTWYGRASESRIVETSDDLMIWKLPVFRLETTRQVHSSGAHTSKAHPGCAAQSGWRRIYGFTASGGRVRQGYNSWRASRTRWREALGYEVARAKGRVFRKACGID